MIDITVLLLKCRRWLHFWNRQLQFFRVSSRDGRSHIEKAVDPEADFESLCQVLKVLVEQGVENEKALQLVRDRFRKEGGHWAAWVLHEADHEEDISLFVEKVREFYAQ